MKYWLSGVVALCLASSAAAENFQLVYSPSLKLEIWVDNVKSKNASGWCAKEVPLRIVSRESKDPEVLKDFLPRVSGLMSSECNTLQSFSWQMNDREGNMLAQGTSNKAAKWAVEITPPPEPEAPPAETAEQPAPSPEDLSPAADTTPWLQFSLINGCHFRTWWDNDSQASALFVPGKKEFKCSDDGWMHGASSLTRSENGSNKSTRVTFISGFPVEGLKKSDDALRITTVNNQRMVLSNEKSPQSWLILPWQPQTNSWGVNGMIAVQMTQQEADDSNVLKARLDEVRKSWGSYLANSQQTIALVQTLSPQLKDPAAGAFRTLK